MDRWTDAASPFVDAATTVSALLATWMVARKLLENWLYWIAIDLASIGLYLSRDLSLTATLLRDTSCWQPGAIGLGVHNGKCRRPEVLPRPVAGLATGKTTHLPSGTGGSVEREVVATAFTIFSAHPNSSAGQTAIHPPD